jgi:hypothetical protein
MTELNNPSITISIDPPDSKELSPKSTFCSVDGCFRMKSIHEICDEHFTFTSLDYLIAHKPLQSPVTTSKYNSEQRGLSCIHTHTSDK